MERLGESENRMGIRQLRFALSPFWRRVVMLCLFLISVELVIFIYAIYGANPQKIEEKFLQAYSDPTLLFTQIINEPGAECFAKQNCERGKTLHFYFDGNTVYLAKEGLRRGFTPLGDACDRFAEEGGTIFCPFAMRVDAIPSCQSEGCEKFDLVYQTKILHRSPFRVLQAFVADREPLAGRFPLSHFQGPEEPRAAPRGKLAQARAGTKAVSRRKTSLKPVAKEKVGRKQK